MKKKLNLLWNLKFNFFSVAERPLTFFAYFLNAKKVGRRRLVIVPATAGGLPLFPHAASGACGRKQKGDAGMTLGEAKSEVLKLLDETKPKADLTGKLDRFFDMGQKEVALYYPIWREKTYAAEDEKTLPQDCCKPRYVIVDGIAHPYTKYSQLPDAFTLRYEAYPADIPDNAPDETEFDLPDEAVLAVIFFAAAQTQSMEYDQRFFQSFYAQYQGKLSNLSGQADGPAAVVTGGCNV